MDWNQKNNYFSFNSSFKLVMPLEDLSKIKVIYLSMCCLLKYTGVYFSSSYINERRGKRHLGENVWVHWWAKCKPRANRQTQGRLFVQCLSKYLWKFEITSAWAATLVSIWKITKSNTVTSFDLQVHKHKFTINSATHSVFEKQVLLWYVLIWP